MSSKPKVFVTRGDNDPGALAVLSEKCEVEVYPEGCPCPRDVLLKGVKGKDALFIMPQDKMDQELLDAAGPQLKVIGTHSVGYDHIDVPLMKKNNIKVGYTPGVLSEAVGEVAVCLTLMVLRRVNESAKQITADGWKHSNAAPFWMVGNTLNLKTVGIVGLGRIGLEAAKRFKGFNVNLIYSGHSEKKEGTEIGAKFVSFDQLVRESDVIVLTCNLTPETKEMFNKDVFKKMKNTAVIVNCSRGGTIHQDDLIEALKSGTIAGAGLDVMTPEPLPCDHPLTTMPNVTLTPHIGSSARETRLDMARLVVDNIIAGLEGKTMRAGLC